VIKPTPNPPEADSTSPYETLDSKKFHEAAERALDHYLNPLLPRKPLLKPNARYLIAPGIDSEELLADACETLTSAKSWRPTSPDWWTARRGMCCWALRN